MTSNWPTVKLGNYCKKIGSGATPRGGASVYMDNGEICLIRSQNVHNEGFNPNGLVYIDENAANKLNNVTVEENDVLLNITGDSVARVCLAKSSFLPARVNQHVAIIRPNEDEFDPRFIRYLLASPTYQNILLSIAAVGATRNALTKGMIENLDVLKPPIERQIEMANQLEALDKKIDINSETNQTLEQMAQAIFKSWFVDFDPVKAKIETLAAGGSANDAELAAMCVISAKTLDELNSLKASNPEAFNKLAQTAALFPAAMQDSELGEIPEGWEVKQLSQICQVINGRAYKNTEFKTEGTPIVRIQNLSNGGKTVYSDLELPPEKYIDREDFIYAWSATFGPHIWRGPKSIYHYHIWKMEVDESVISRYFLYLSMFRKTEAMKNAGTGSIFTHLTKKIMESQHVLIGDHAINKKFSDIIVPIFDQISSLKNESTYLADIRDALLPKLLTGDGLTSEVANDSFPRSRVGMHTELTNG